MSQSMQKHRGNEFLNWKYYIAIPKRHAMSICWDEVYITQQFPLHLSYRRCYLFIVFTCF